MYEYLKDHAITNVWCNGDQDNQLIIAGQRITKLTGELNRFKLMNKTTNLPTQGKFYHVFQVGQVHPNVLGLLSVEPDWAVEKWIKFSDAINSLKVFVNIYNDFGIELPRFKSYYMFSNSRNLIFAIEQDVNFPVNYSSDKFYVRLYSNAYFQSARADAVADYLHCEGKLINNNEDILALQAQYNDYASKSGYTFSYNNGLLIDRIDAVNVRIGDTVEFIYDSSVKRIVTFTVSNLQTFSSILDSKYKYLLHHLSGSNDTIDYQDDIDIHILNEYTDGRYKGCYYHRNSLDSHRMITHRDYSIPVDYFNFLATDLNQKTANSTSDIRGFKIQLKVRNSGYHRPLIHDNNRIFELYKLLDADILQAMVGINSTVPEWRADNLENSSYSQIMKSQYNDINLSLIQQGYGYNSISKIVGNTPSRTILNSGVQSTAVPYGLYENCTAYEYDQDGSLLGFHYHLIGTEYNAANLDTRLVEIISGKGTYSPDVVFGSNNIPLPILDNYRVYMCYFFGMLPDNNWVDITDGPLYSVVNNILIWNNLEFGQYLMVRSDKTFLAYDLDILPVAGTLFFTLSELETRDLVENNYTLPVPMGELDIFLNGKSLIRGLDYIVKFPEVHIINKNFLIQPANVVQHIHVRFTGFSNADLSLDDIEDFGFIEHGFMSNNSKHDIRDDRVLRITMNGTLKHRDDIVFSEQHDGISVSNPINGMPYQVKDIVVPLKQLVNENTYSLRDKSIAVDKRISDYMTIKLPQPTRDAVSSIYERYPVISPFMTHIINDLYNGQIDDSMFINVLSDNDILNICKPYEGILAFDPISQDNRLNGQFVIVHPHSLNTTIDLNIYQYRFLLRVVKLYCNGLIELSPFITFSS